MSYTENSIFNRVLAAVLSFIMVVTLLPMSILPVIAAGEETVSGYTVKVLDTDGNAIEGATVTLSGTRRVMFAQEDWSVSLVTDEAGAAVFTATELGDNLVGYTETDVTIAVAKEGYEAGSATAKLAPWNYEGGSTEVKLEAIPKYTVSVETAENSTVTLNDSVTDYVTDYKDKEVEVVITPEVGYAITEVQYNYISMEVPEEGAAFEDTIKLSENVIITYTVTAREYTVDFADGSDEHGDIVLSEDNPEKLTYKSEFKATVTAEEGFVISSVAVDGSEYTAEHKNVAEAEIAFEVTGNTTITVTYAALHNVDIVIGENGTGSGTYGNTSGTALVDVVNGDKVTITAKPNVGYEIHKVIEIVGETEKEITVDKAGFEQEFTITADTKYTISFVIKQYGITVKGDAEKGKVEAPETVEHGSDAVITVTPKNGYVVDKITVGEADVAFTAEDDVATYTVENVTAALEVTVTYKLKQYGITVKGDAEKGKVEAPATVEHGSDAVIKVTPATGYVVDKITVDGEEVDFTAKNDVATCTVENVTAALEIAVTYKLKQYVINVVLTGGDVTLWLGDEQIETKTTDSGVMATVEHGSDVTIKVTPVVGFIVESVNVNNNNIEFSTDAESDECSITLEDVGENKRVYVAYKLKETTADKSLMNLIFADGCLLREAEVGTETKKINGEKKDFSVITYVIKSGGKVSIVGADGVNRYSYNYSYNGGSAQKYNTNTNSATPFTVNETTKQIDIWNIGVYTKNGREVVTDDNGNRILYRFVIDEEAPSVEMEPSNVNGAPGYHKDNFEVTITANDLPENYYSGIAKVELGYSYLIGDAPVTGTIAVAPNADTEGKWTAAVDLSQFPETDVTLTVTVTDLAGNSTPDSYKLVADRTAPVVDVEFRNNEVKNEKYFSADRTATVTVTDVNFDPANTFALINDKRIDWTEDKNFATDDPAKHRMIIEFEKDGDYTFTVIATDKAGNAAAGVNYAEGTAAPEEFTVDKTEPTELNISYSDGIFDTVINGLSFGFFGKDTVKVTLAAGDALSGIDYFIYYAPVENNDNGITYDFIEINTAADFSFYIPAQYRGKVKFTAVDMAGNQVSLEDGRIIVVDNIDPIVSVDLTTDSGNAPAENNGEQFYKENVTATITITEANFFGTEEWAFEDYDPADDNVKAPYLAVTVIKTYNDGTTATEDKKPVFTKQDGDTYISEAIVLDEDADYEFKVNYKDHSGNSGSASKMFTIDKIAPVIDVEFDNNNVKNDFYFNADRIATITVTEHKFNAEKTFVVINGTSICWTEYDELESANADVHIIELPITEDGDYTFTVETTDKAGNAATGVNYAEGTKAPEEFTIDKTEPVNATVTYQDTGVFHKLLESMKFGFYKETADVTFTVEDSLSGIDYIEYFTAVDDGTEPVKTTVDMNGAKETVSHTVTIDAQYRGKLTFVAYNMAGNAVKLTGETTVVVDNIAPELSVEYTTESGKGPVENGGKLYYGEDVTATITITEANFFGTEEWNADDYYTLIPGAEDKDTQYLEVTVTTTYNDGSEVTKSLYPKFTKIGDTDTYVSDSIKFIDDADYVITVEYSDRSGNERKSDTAIYTVDKIAPVIDVEFRNNDVVNEKYFSANRTAIITVTEHNFDPENTFVVINGTPICWTEYTELESAIADAHTIEHPFTEDGDYTFTVKTTDKAGKEAKGVNYAEGTKAPEEFTIDKTEPTDLEISYSGSIFETIINALTFGFFGDDKVTVTLTVKDDISGIDYITYSAPVEEGASSVNTGIVETTRDYSNDKTVSYSFDIPAQYRGKVKFTAVNMAALQSTLEDGKTVVVDNIDPIVSVDLTTESGDAPAENNGEQFYDENVTATITIKEANFFGTEEWVLEDYDPADDNVKAPYLAVTVIKTYNDGTTATEDMKPVFTKQGGDTYVSAPVVLDEDADYEFKVNYKDHSGNSGSDSKKFTIDKTAPLINVEYDNNDVRNGECFNADRTVTITVTEHNFDPALITIPLKVTYVVEGKDNNYTYPVDNLNWTSVGDDVYAAYIEMTDEARYSFSVSGTDKAGNANRPVTYSAGTAAPAYFIIDKTSPTDLKIELFDSVKNETVSILGNNTVAFGTFYDHPVTVKLSANGGLSNISALEYQKVSSVKDYDPNGSWIAYNDDMGISIGTGEKFVIFFNATDCSGNDNLNDGGKSTVANSIGIIVDNKAPVGIESELEIDILPQDHTDDKIYAGDVTVDFKVTDPKYIGENKNENGFYAGIASITYKIEAADIGKVVEGVLFSADTVPATTFAQHDGDGLAHTVTGSLVIDSEIFNSNNIVVTITAVDNAGNEKVTFTEAGAIKIDTTMPQISVTYDNNTADSGKYFDADRVATIVVTERNFNADDFLYSITRDGVAYPVTLTWASAPAGDNGDATTWTATVSYTTDGDYVFTVDSFTDLAGNKLDGAATDYGTSVAPNEFTLDYIKPVINVTYSNNNSANGNYYNADRVATVVITEHNLDPNGADKDRIVVTVGATDDGVPTAAPVITAWTTVGDTHTASISYTADALYTFDISVADKAGNDSVDFAQQSFYVDKTAPSLSITGVENESANNGEVIPVITYSDTNFNADAVSITLSGANRGALELDGSYADIHNGLVFTFSDFEREEDADDIYTLSVELVDMAGNASSETIVFSVNRFGSTYALDDSTKELIGQYVKVPTDVIVTETNANELSGIKVTLFKNNETIVLTEGEDYRIDLEGGEGNWYKYTYVIFAKNFEADGVYSITVESDDAAGNEAKNNLDTKNTEITFGVDNTLPIINIANLEDRNTYATDKLTVEMSVEDNLKLAKVIVELDGKNIKEWMGDELTALVNGGGNFTFDIDGTSTEAHKLVVYAIDAAGNGEIIAEEELPANAETVEGFFVTTNLWVRYFTNKPLFFGSIAAAVLVVGLVIFLIIFKKKKKEDKKEGK